MVSAKRSVLVWSNSSYALDSIVYVSDTIYEKFDAIVSRSPRTPPDPPTPLYSPENPASYVAYSPSGYDDFVAVWINAALL